MEFTKEVGTVEKIVQQEVDEYVFRLTYDEADALYVLLDQAALYHSPVQPMFDALYNDGFRCATSNYRVTTSDMGLKVSRRGEKVERDG